MYTESQIREQLTKQGYKSDVVDVILKQFPLDGSDIDFNGNNCADLDSDWNDGVPCTGWDGLDRRCSCGNRRVYWVIDGDFAYGEAY